MSKVFQLRNSKQVLGFRSLGVAQYIIGLRNQQEALHVSPLIPPSPVIQYKHLSPLPMDTSLQHQLNIMGIEPNHHNRLRFSKGMMFLQKEVQETVQWHVFNSHMYTYMMYPIEKGTGIALLQKCIEETDKYLTFDVLLVDPQYPMETKLDY